MYTSAYPLDLGKTWYYVLWVQYSVKFSYLWVHRIKTCEWQIEPNWWQDQWSPCSWLLPGMGSGTSQGPGAVNHPLDSRSSWDLGMFSLIRHTLRLGMSASPSECFVAWQWRALPSRPAPRRFHSQVETFLQIFNTNLSPTTTSSTLFIWATTNKRHIYNT